VPSVSTQNFPRSLPSFPSLKIQPYPAKSALASLNILVQVYVESNKPEVFHETPSHPVRRESSAYPSPSSGSRPRLHWHRSFRRTRLGIWPGILSGILRPELLRRTITRLLRALLSSLFRASIHSASRSRLLRPSRRLPAPPVNPGCHPRPGSPPPTALLLRLGRRIVRPCHRSRHSRLSTRPRTRRHRTHRRSAHRRPRPVSLLQDRPLTEPGPLLKAVSRSFYLSLRFLPAATRGPLSLGYLARTSDTLADSESLPVEARIEALKRLRSRHPKRTPLLDPGALPSI